jgi:two-component system phosphate regulon response regulator PhoB
MILAVTEQPLILIAEDDEDIRDLVAFSMRRAGYRTVVAADGLDTLKKANSEQPSLVLLDIGMPGLDGKAVCRILQSKGFEAPPVIFLTARSQTQDRVDGLELGAVDYVVKPFEMAELVARVRLALRTQERLATVGDEAIARQREKVRAEQRRQQALLAAGKRDD